MCCGRQNPAVLGQRRSPAGSPRPRPKWAVFDGEDTAVSLPFSTEAGAEKKRKALCGEIDDCTLHVELV